MNLFGDIDLTKLFDPDSEYGKSYVFGELTDEMIARAEQTLGYKMPASYIELLKVQNGGMISDEFDESWLNKEKYLIYQRRTRKSILTVRSKHDVIGHIHAIRNKVLQ